LSFVVVHEGKFEYNCVLLCCSLFNFSNLLQMKPIQWQAN
jgi:hypothetical protein